MISLVMYLDVLHHASEVKADSLLVVVPVGLKGKAGVLSHGNCSGIFNTGQSQENRGQSISCAWNSICAVLMDGMYIYGVNRWGKCVSSTSQGGPENK
jgi:hypothetical protein